MAQKCYTSGADFQLNSKALERYPDGTLRMEGAVYAFGLDDVADERGGIFAVGDTGLHVLEEGSPAPLSCDEHVFMPSGWLDADSFGFALCSGSTLVAANTFLFYFYAYWAVYIASAIALFFVCMEVFRSALSAFSGLMRLGTVVFRWAALASLIVSLTSIHRSSRRDGDSRYRLRLDALGQHS